MDVSDQLHDPAALFQRKQPPGTQRTADCLSPRAGINDVEKTKISCLCRELNHGLPAVQAVAYSQ
jgi:hypothetical protein